MAFIAKASGEIFSNVGFLIVPIGGYIAMITFPQLLFGMLTDICTALWGRDGSNGTLFDAVGLILSSTHPLPSQNLIKKSSKIFKKKFCQKTNLEPKIAIWNASKAKKKKTCFVNY